MSAYKNNIALLFVISLIFLVVLFTSGCSQNSTTQNSTTQASTTKFIYPDKRPPHSVGPGGGGWIGFPAINPQDPANVAVSCDMGSTFISQNATSDDFFFTQPRLNLETSSGAYGSVLYFFSPNDSNIVYALSARQAFISHDKGRSWSYFAPKEENIAGVIDKIIYKEDQHFVGAGTHPSNTQIYLLGLYVDPADTTSNTIYIASWGNSFYLDTPTGGRNVNVTEVYQTTNGGDTWNRITRILDTHSGNYVQDYNRYARMIIHDGFLHLMTTAGMFIIDPNIPDIYDSIIYKNSFQNLGAQYIVDGNDLYMYMFVHLPEDKRREIRKYRYTNKAYDTTKYTVITHDFKQRLYNWSGSNNTLQDGNLASFDRFDVAKNATSITVYVSFTNAPTVSNKYNSIGVAVSHNDGLTWTRALEGCGDDSNSYNNTSFNNVRHAGPTDVYTRNIIGFNGLEGGITVNSSNTNHAIATGSTDGYQTFDGGRTWVALSSKRVDDGANPVPQRGDIPQWTTRGIDPTGLDDFAVNPFNLNHHLAGYTDVGLFESFDAGESWTRINFHRASGFTGFFHKNFNLTNCHSVAFDPHNRGIYLAGMSAIHDLRYQNSGRLRSFAQYLNDAGSGVNSIKGYIMKRNADGVWTTTTIELDNAQLGFLINKQTQNNIQSKAIATNIIFDPHTRGVVYASVYGLGVIKSTDSGSNWHFINDGINPQQHIGSGSDAPLPGIFSRRMTLSKDGKTLFLELISLRTNSNSPTGGNIWQSTMIGQVYYLDITSGIEKWKELNRPNYNNPNLRNTLVPPGINGIDKCQNGNIYAAPVRRTIGERNTPFNGGNIDSTEGGGAFVSIDNGSTWRQIFDERFYVEDIIVSSRNPNVLFMTAHNGVFASIKGKDTTTSDWIPMHDTRIGGYGHRSYYKIWELPNDPTCLYISTMGGGAWRIPIPKAVLDTIDPMRLSWNSTLNSFFTSGIRAFYVNVLRSHIPKYS